MTTRQISETIEDIYGFEVSNGMVYDITDRLLPQIEDWQKWSLGEIYSIVFVDAVHFSVHDNGQIKKFAAYVILAVSLISFCCVLFHQADIHARQKHLLFERKCVK